jgi:hypothetical protein
MNIPKLAEIRIRKYNLSQQQIQAANRNYQIPTWIRFPEGVRPISNLPARR